MNLAIAPRLVEVNGKNKHSPARRGNQAELSMRLAFAFAWEEDGPSGIPGIHFFRSAASVFSALALSPLFSP
jgi:hypothetical protein